ncbi:hypothetical protein A2U01_0051171, partial [Trifolium medium]|nr:hypothetical protein [Trifolium medium]
VVRHLKKFGFNAWSSAFRLFQSLQSNPEFNRCVPGYLTIFKILAERKRDAQDYSRFLMHMDPIVIDGIKAGVDFQRIFDDFISGLKAGSIPYYQCFIVLDRILSLTTVNFRQETDPF